ncbi:hypothetical protein [Chitinophaga flava]|uniref:Uncharacterized protein n=1 Tax=Chitinophaga flava TaxID=2259036 RepID=A0A365Y6L1_9BACT|nr:hypothetical protein [Chitinophaga flava]RBL93968.1 hypothetical protein DF182_15905 [Chitinophaga flava]
MKPFTRKLLWTLLTPLGIALLMAISGSDGIMGAGLLLLFVTPMYLLVGLVLVMFSDSGVETGKALLLSSGIILLVGLSTCGLIVSNLRLGGMH